MTTLKGMSNAFDLSHDHKLTCHMGHLVPVMCEEVCPGDIFRWNADVLVRLMPMLAPIMHDVSVFLHCFYVPTRLLFDGFEKFITGGEDGTDNTTWPYVEAPERTGFAVGSLADYLGLPTGVSGIQVSALPFRACAKIYNDWYRDQNLISPIAMSTAAGFDEETNMDIQRRAWPKDLYTGSLPWAQRGDPVYLPLGVDAPVVYNNGIKAVDNTDLSGKRISIENYTPNGVYTASGLLADKTTIANDNIVANTYSDADKPTLFKADLSKAASVTINDFRVAKQIQKYKELLARGGSRYIEWLLSMFGVRSSDARLQRSEYLGGGRCPIDIGEVLQTSSTDSTTTQGNMAGRGVSYQNVPQFTKYFEEYGYLICFMSIMPRASYQQGVRKMWLRKTRWDYPNPLFARLGNQAVKNIEVYAQDPTVVDENGISQNELTFGYNERFEELRRVPSSVHAQFRNTLNYWHMGRIFDNKPELNKSFVECNPTKRIFAVTDLKEDECIVQIHHNLQAIRRFPKNGNPE